MQDLKRWRRYAALTQKASLLHTFRFDKFAVLLMTAKVYSVGGWLIGLTSWLQSFPGDVKVKSGSVL